MENHIRLKDPERHKAKLLEIIQGGEYVDKAENKTVQDITIRNWNTATKFSFWLSTTCKNGWSSFHIPWTQKRISAILPFQ
jgi:hypothetical protein